MIIRTRGEPASDPPEPLWVPIAAYIVFVAVYGVFLRALRWDIATSMKVSVLILGATWILLRSARLRFQGEETGHES